MKYMKKMNEGKTDDILKLSKLSGVDASKCAKVYDECDGDMEEAISILGKKKKEKKIFQVGDIVIRTTLESGKYTPDQLEFLKTYKYFKIRNISDSLNIDIGYVSPEGKTFYFSPNKFELKDKPKIVVEPVKKEINDIEKAQEEENPWMPSFGHD